MNYLRHLSERTRDRILSKARRGQTVRQIILDLGLRYSDSQVSRFIRETREEELRAEAAALAGDLKAAQAPRLAPAPAPAPVLDFGAAAAGDLVAPLGTDDLRAVREKLTTAAQALAEAALALSHEIERRTA